MLLSDEEIAALIDRELSEKRSHIQKSLEKEEEEYYDDKVFLSQNDEDTIGTQPEVELDNDEVGPQINFISFFFRFLTGML